MTRVEISVLEVLVNEFRDFRRDDARWKEDTDKWRADVSEFVAGKKAIEDRDAARGVSRRAYVAAVIAALGIAVSIGLGVLNLVT